MTRDEIIRMAREACDADKVDAWYGGFWTLTQEELERFAAIVAAAEREECAKLCDSFKNKALGAQSGPDDELSNVILRQAAHLGHAECAAAIRARSQA